MSKLVRPPSRTTSRLRYRSSYLQLSTRTLLTTPTYWAEQGQSAVDPARLIVPMLQRFIATDRGFAKARRTLTPGSAD